MAGSWEWTHRRYGLVHAVADDVAQHGSAAMARWHAEIAAEFGGTAEFLADVQRCWYAAFDARLDGVLEAGEADLEHSVTALYRSVARTHRSFGAVLEAFADDPALADGQFRHRRTLLAATGIDEAALRFTGRCAVVSAAADHRIPLGQ